MNEYTERNLLQTIIDSTINGKIGIIMYTIMFIFIISIYIYIGERKNLNYMKEEY